MNFLILFRVFVHSFHKVTGTGRGLLLVSLQVCARLLQKEASELEPAKQTDKIRNYNGDKYTDNTLYPEIYSTPKLIQIL